MGQGGITVTTSQMIRAGALFVAFVLCFVGIFTAWWTIESRVSGTAGGQPINGGSTVDSKPYSAGDLADDRTGGKGLDTEAVLTGLFFNFAILGVGALLVLELMSIIGRSVPSMAFLVATGVAVVLGLTAVLYTAFAWPAGFADGEYGFYDSQQNSSQGLTSKVTFMAGIGWYFAIVGAILVPLGVFVQEMRSPRPDPAPQVTAPQRLPEPVYAPLAAPPPVAPTPVEPPVPATSTPSVRRAAVVKPKAKK